MAAVTLTFDLLENGKVVLQGHIKCNLHTKYDVGWSSHSLKYGTRRKHTYTPLTFLRALETVTFRGGRTNCLFKSLTA